MLPIFNNLRDINSFTILFRMVLAVLCGAVIGIERSIKNRPAGFRTHILIIVGATTASLTGHYVYLVMSLPTDMSRLGAQVITGLGLYMDSYVNDETSSWYFGPIDGSRLEYLRRNMAQALSGTDEYVWLWGERGRWIDWKKVAEPMRVHGGAIVDSGKFDWQVC